MWIWGGCRVDAVWMWVHLGIDVGPMWGGGRVSLGLIKCKRWGWENCKTEEEEKPYTKSKDF